VSLFNWWKRLRGEADEPEEEAPREPGPIRLPTEPFVFECRQCHKIFEARKKHPACPECDSEDVQEMG
jgi:Zn finger protein HypA/HybF involved in hydrogenase expression